MLNLFTFSDYQRTCSVSSIFPFLLASATFSRKHIYYNSTQSNKQEITIRKHYTALHRQQSWVILLYFLAINPSISHSQDAFGRGYWLKRIWCVVRLILHVCSFSICPFLYIPYWAYATIELNTIVLRQLFLVTNRW